MYMHIEQVDNEPVRYTPTDARPGEIHRRPIARATLAAALIHTHANAHANAPSNEP